MTTFTNICVGMLAFTGPISRMGQSTRTRIQMHAPNFEPNNLPLTPLPLNELNHHSMAEAHLGHPHLENNNGQNFPATNGAERPETSKTVKTPLNDPSTKQQEDFLSAAKRLNLETDNKLAGELIIWFILVCSGKDDYAPWIRYLKTTDYKIDNQRFNGARLYVSEAPIFLSWFTTEYGAEGWRDFITFTTGKWSEPIYKSLSSHPFIHLASPDNP